VGFPQVTPTYKPSNHQRVCLLFMNILSDISVFNTDSYCVKYGQLLCSIRTVIVSNMERYCVQYGELLCLIRTVIVSNTDNYYVQYG
jgi:hypothetical protein